jgi:cell division FtsZ-interacting protein ZapD
MSSLKKALLKQGLKLISDPRVVKWMQDERVMRMVMRAMSMPGKAQSFAREQLEHAARVMSLATEGEVKDLRRTVRRLEDELATLKNEQTAPSARKSNAAE